MSRTQFATLAGTAFVLAWIVAAVTLADHLPPSQVLRAIYFVTAGALWVIPVRYLMVWSLRRSISENRPQKILAPENPGPRESRPLTTLAPESE